MKRFINDLSTNAKLSVGFGILLVLLAGVVITAYAGLTRIAQTELELRDIHSAEVIHLEQLRSLQNYNRAEILEMMLANNLADQQAGEKIIQENARQINNIVEVLATLDPTHVGLQSQIQELTADIDAYRQIREQEISLIYSGKVNEARQIGLTTGADAFGKINAISLIMSNQASAELDSQLAADQQAAQSATLVFLSIGGIALLLAVVMVIILNQTIARPLTGIARVADQIGSGDLTVNLPDEPRRDEIGALTRAFQKMMGTLRRSTGDLTEAVGLLGSSASEILASTTQVASGTAQTATAINETTTTVEEVRQAAQLSSQKAQDVSDNAQRVAQVSQNGQRAVEETSAGMDRIREQMETIARTVVRLSEQSQSIGGIIASVNDLADQSNLLAVNAAIEAAKAGEQGKGFAVVAQEIKSLAEQSKQATAQVRTILSDVQKATGNAVMATEQGSKAVEAGVKQATQAGEAIRVLAEASGEAVQAATQIVASGRQQVVGMDQIGLAMENINQAGAQNAASMRQMEVAAQNLHELGQKLKELTTQFKV
jgi:methyl-accepting chemotaxis protein